MLKDLKRSALRVGLFVLMVAALPFVLLFAWHINNVLFANPRYAAEVFEQFLDEFAVLESRRWHPIGGQFRWDCTFAIVGLPETVPDSPPQRKRADTWTSWQLEWGGNDWRPTPAAPLPTNTRDAIGSCAHNWAPLVADRIGKALAQPGSFVIIGPSGESVHLYSKPYKIAARVRFGD
ncbi:hypothetical protein [uncultured Litoreibacter sp.]|uniref:hypothetical protein n=1 Tax=uncultured Litoreibacter sp. TaxID=1392394 RepID=UPI002637BD67|nr:hypothetical protein [uncultured Litoreibacter sp.]